jgi:hypothetical protein
MPPSPSDPKSEPPKDHIGAPNPWKVDPDSMRGREWLLILDKVVSWLIRTVTWRAKVVSRMFSPQHVLGSLVLVRCPADSWASMGTFGRC